MKKLIVFDLDGTLHHTELALAPAIATAVASITGEPEPSFALVNSLYGEPLEVFCKILLGTDEESVCRRFKKQVQKQQARTLPSNGKLYSGVTEMLSELQAMEFDLAILSNAHLEYIHLVTDTLEIRRCFKRLRGRSDESSKAARLAEMSTGYDFTVMVGDRYHDIQAGLENSFPIIACSYGYGSSEEHKGAITVDSAAQIVPEVRKLIKLYTGKGR
jgi:phosphoglycolate phosphatase-like HAD superfamily hydrolase